MTDAETPSTSRTDDMSVSAVAQRLVGLGRRSPSGYTLSAYLARQALILPASVREISLKRKQDYSESLTNKQADRPKLRDAVCQYYLATRGPNRKGRRGPGSGRKSSQQSRSWSGPIKMQHDRSWIAP